MVSSSRAGMVRAVWPPTSQRRGCVSVGALPLLGRAERRFFRVVVSPMPVPAVVVAMWGGVRASAAGALARFWAKA